MFQCTASAPPSFPSNEQGLLSYVVSNIFYTEQEKGQGKEQTLLQLHLQEKEQEQRRQQEQMQGQRQDLRRE